MVYKTNISQIRLDASGILIAEHKPGVEATKEDIIACIDIYGNLCQDRKRPNLLVIGRYMEFDLEAVKFNAPARQNAFFSAQAIVVQDLPQRILVRHYCDKFPAEYERRIFGSVEDARQWLGQFTMPTA